MATHRCKEFLQLSRTLDGRRTPARRASAPARLPRLPSIVERSRMHPNCGARMELAPKPIRPDRIWTSLRAQLEAEGLIAKSIPASAQHREHPRRLVRGFIPGNARAPRWPGAYLAALVAVAFALSGPVTQPLQRSRWLEGTQDSTPPLSTQLNSAEQTAVSSFGEATPDVTASLHQNLAIVDNYIALCEKSVQRRSRKRSRARLSLRRLSAESGSARADERARRLRPMSIISLSSSKVESARPFSLAAPGILFFAAAPAYAAPHRESISKLNRAPSSPFTIPTARLP